MRNPNKSRKAKSNLKSNEGLNLPKTLDPSSASSIDASQSSVDATRPDGSTSSSKRTCAICLGKMRKKDKKAIFKAECSHKFHFDCITSNVKHGNKICPLCRTEWTQVPMSVRDTVPAIPAQTGFEDDESLPQGEAQIQSDGDHHSGRAVHSGVAQREALEIKLLPQVSAVTKPVSRSDFAVLVHLKAEGESDARPTRAPLDLITVLDVSGSMEGMKLELLKNAMRFAIRNLGETDRLSVIAFSSTARRLFPLRLMSETGKQAAIQAVNALVADGGTNIAEGLKIGAKVIADRRWKNPVSVMMLLSDGQDNYTLSRSRVHDYESLLPGSTSRIPIHTFGFGSDHDAELMHSISQVSSGTFSFIESETVIRDAFAQCIGGLLSVVVLEQVVEIECVHEQGLKISSIKSGSYRNRISSDARTARIDVGDMYAEEERDFIVVLEIPCCDNGSEERESMSLLKVRCVYKDPVRRERVVVESEEVTIQRPMELTGEEVVSIEVDRQLNRFLVSQAMSEARVLADGGNLNAAVELLRNRERDLSETPSARSSDRLCQSLSSELSALQETMTSQRMYESSGRASFFASMSSHGAQRATVPGQKVGLIAARRTYRTGAMDRMLKRSRKDRS